MTQLGPADKHGLGRNKQATSANVPNRQKSWQLLLFLSKIFPILNDVDGKNLIMLENCCYTSLIPFGNFTFQQITHPNKN
jgi:hypothetical protein